MKATRKCSFCGKSFVTRSGMQRYCSEACQAEARRARMTQKNNLFKAVRPIMEIQHEFVKDQMCRLELEDKTDYTGSCFDELDAMLGLCALGGTECLFDC